MLDLPMEPTTFPNEDPGPQALLTSLAPQDTLDRLDWVLARGSAYVGLAGSLGSRFTASREAVEPILREVQERGLMFLERRTPEASLVAVLAGEIGSSEDSRVGQECVGPSRSSWDPYPQKNKH